MDNETLLRLFTAYIRHVFESEGTTFLYNDDVDYVMERANLTPDQRKEFSTFVDYVHDQINQTA